MILEQIINGIKSYQHAMNGKKPEKIVLRQNAYDLLKSEVQKYMAIDDEADARFEGIPIIIAERDPYYAVLCSGHVHATDEEVNQHDQKTQAETHQADHPVPGMLAVEPDQHP